MIQFDDVSAAHRDRLEADRDEEVNAAIGELPPALAEMFFTLSGSVIHDLYSLRHLLGAPVEVLTATDLHPAHGLTITLEYPRDVKVVLTWVDLPQVWHFDETLAICGDDRRVLLNSPTGFAGGLLTGLTVEGEDGTSFTLPPQVAWENAFRPELRHFHESITSETACKTPISDAASDLDVITQTISLLRSAKG